MNYAPSSKPAILARSIAALLVATVLHHHEARAADGTWLGNSGNWSDNTALPTSVWSGGTIADGADFTAFFTGVDIAVDQAITLDTARTIGNITFTDATTASNNLTISGANTLTLDVTTGSPVINVTNQALTISSVIDGTDGLLKDGAGSLSLQGANIFTGGLTIRNGTVNAQIVPTSLSSGMVTMGGAGSSGASVISGQALGNAFIIKAPDSGVISVGSNSGGSGPTFSGAFTLNGNLTLNSPAFTTGTTTLSGGLTGTGNLTVNNAGTTSPMVVSTAALDHIGSITVQGASTGATTISAAIGANVTGITKTSTGTLTLSGTNSYTGSTTISTGTLSLGNTSALGGTSAITLAGGTTLASTLDGISISAPITLGNSGTTSTIIAPNDGVGGNTRTLTLNGAIGGAGNLTLSANTNTNTNATIILNAAGTYTGSTLLTTTNVNVNSFTRLGVNNALPTTTVLTIGGTNGTGTGRFIDFNLNGRDQTLAGLTNTTGLYSRTQRIYSSTAATLTINNATNNNFSGRIGLNGTNLSLTKSGAGTLTLGGANSYIGATTVNGGALVLDFSQTGSILTNTPGNYIAAASTLTLGGTSFSVTGRANGSAVASTAWTATAATNVARITFTTLPTGLVVGQAIAGTNLGAATYIVAVSGNNVIVNGNVSATSGTFSTAATSVTTSQTFASTTLNAGASALSINANGGDGTRLALNAITRNVGGTVNFTQPGGTISATNGFTTTTPNTDGILGGWATVGGTDWATNDGTNIVALGAGSYTLTSVAGTTMANYSGANIDVDNSAGLVSGVIAPNTLRFNAASANTVTLAAGTSTITSGGIVVSSNVGNNLSTITGGTLQGASGQDLIVNQHNSGNGLTIASVIDDNTTATGLTKTGAGLLTLSGANNYTGATTLSAGTLSVDVTGNLGAAASNLVFAGGTLQVTGTTLTSISGIGHTVSFNADKTVGLEIAEAANTFTVDQVLNQTTGGFSKLGAGTAILDQANTYTGTTTVSGGTLKLTGNRTANAGAISVISGALIEISHGTFSLAGNTLSVGSLSGTSTLKQNGGNISFASGAQVLVGSGAGDGVYELSAGTLATAAVTSRGVILGVNAGRTGTFNLSSTGALNMAATSVLQIGRSENTAATGTTGIFNQTGGTATVGELRIGGQNFANNADTTATLNLSGGTFSAVTFTNLSQGDTSNSTINISGTADVTLPAFPTARGSSSTATITFDGGTLKPRVASATYLGGLTDAFIKAGGARIDTTNGSITITQDLLTDAVSTGGGLTKAGSNALTLAGTNTYTGATNVNAGTLNIGGTLGAGANVINANAGMTNISVSQTLGAVNIADGAVVTLTSVAPSPAEGEAAAAFDGFEAFGAELGTEGNASGVAAVPEPGSISLLLFGALGLFGGRRRRACAESLFRGFLTGASESLARDS